MEWSETERNGGTDRCLVSFVPVPFIGSSGGGIAQVVHRSAVEQVVTLTAGVTVSMQEWLFLHKIRYAKLFEAIVKWTKIHVQIMRYTCCLNMGFVFVSFTKGPDLFVWKYTESNAARTDHYVDVFGRENVARVMTLWRRYAVRKFNPDAILFWENKCKKNGIFKF